MKYEGYEFNHIKNRKGNDMMLGELNDYLQDKIDDNDYQETSEHYVVECPYCKTAYKTDPTYEGPYLKRKLYILKDGSTGFCFRCDRAFIDKDDKIRFEVVSPEENQKGKEYTLTSLPKVGAKWNLSLYDEFDSTSSEGLEYLTKRNPYLRTLAPALGIKYSEGNPVIPFRIHGELIYYQIRFAKATHSQMRYFSPPIAYKPPYILEHGDNKKFIICEGTFDAIALLPQCPDGTPFAVLGSTITDYQLSILRTYVPEKIIVYMDETQISSKIVSKIRENIPYADVSLIPSSGMDPEEKLNQLILNEWEINWIK